jgi:hypothetical protein
MLIGGISPCSKVVTLRVEIPMKIYNLLSCNSFFKFLVTYFVIKVAIKGWNSFYNRKSGKYQSPKKQPFLSVLSLYPLLGCFLPPFWSHSEPCCCDYYCWWWCCYDSPNGGPLLCVLPPIRVPRGAGGTGGRGCPVHSCKRL